MLPQILQFGEERAEFDAAFVRDRVGELEIELLGEGQTSADENFFGLATVGRA
ncbi:hypothetical protein [Sinorhizobium terangae]|uniref:Uncharacterized protein n=1 Tax=Sinorhizobium terangae TaxID=110322 RepID=A0A6N7LCI5_SINTE|nr:hypothetical protein [Sinorhizobium terangae]MBB4188035.1 hypothetical protein [Sinorhizobium terangae]MQX14414.1 hypothetical protein [Sinorhizobium terangae]WFU49506.1 hypothetical protein QA637_08970 [Sinorhizobium terangae]